MLSRFFIDRPVFASVLSIVITLAGGLALVTLPLAQYPPITPPNVEVSATYPGASARDVAEAVAAPIEQQVNGVEGMMYMSSQCTNDGTYTLSVTFHHGVDLNMAQVLVQNRVALALPQLPDVLKAVGVTTRKRAPDTLLSIGLFSPNGRYDQIYLSNYALLHVRDELARLEGVSEVTLLGERDYSMRVWIDPDRLAARGLMAGDVVRALREQNVQVATGAVGQPPSQGGPDVQVPLDTLGRLTDAEQFQNVVVKSTPEGRLVRLKDVARVELGAKSEAISCRVDGRPSVSMTVRQLPNANAFDVARRVHAQLAELKREFPQGIDYVIRYDTTPYIRESIGEVVKTLRDAVILVAIVVLLFLRNWRSALIPLIAVPVAIIGTFAVMAVMGFSLNNLTLFGLVLAIGIVVDDAIVVVEAVEHHIEHGLEPRAATIRAMEQVSGPVIAVGLVLSAVFVPCAFISGITGQFFRQFALTIAVSTIISAFNSLTLSPALTALLLRRQGKDRPDVLPRLAFALAGGWASYRYLAPWLDGLLPARWQEAAAWGVPALTVTVGLGVGWLAGRPLNGLLGWSFGLFNAGFDRLTEGYVRAVGLLLRGSAVVLLVYGGLLALTWWEFDRTPKGFIPAQDMGYLLVNVQMPDACSLERTQEIMNRAEQIALQTPGVKHTLCIAGQSFLLSAYGSNFGSMFVLLDNFDQRHAPDLRSTAIAAKLRRRFHAELSDGVASVFGPPPVKGVGRAGGFKIMIEQRGDLDPVALQVQTDNLIERANQHPSLLGLFSVFRANVPQLHVEVDRRQCMAMGVDVKDVWDTLSASMGSLYVNDFNRFGRTWPVIVQAEARYRTDADAVRQLEVRSARGAMVPLGSVAEVREVNGPLVLTRYNMYPAAFVNGSAAPGVSSGQAIALMQDLARQELPTSMSFEWTEMAYLELLSGQTATILFAFAVAMVFLVLAAQYESWSLPLAVILVVPMCLLCALAGINLAGMDVNIFSRIGFVVLVGLASKNAILIVEMARARRLAGVPRRTATLEACRQRLRPIVMTSVAFVLGVVPLIVSTGAGAEMRKALGMTVFSGMLGVTLFGIFLTPVFFAVIDWLGATGPLATPALRRWNALVLGLLSLRPLRARLIRPGAPAVINGAAHPVVPHVNGQGSREAIQLPAPLPPAERAPR